MLYFVSDLHIGHSRIMQYTNRPFSSLEEMNEALIDNWNKTVSSKDEVYNLGDFSFLSFEDTCAVLRKLNGNHHLILGNHDKIIIREQDEFLRQGLFKSIQNYKEIKYEKQKIIMLHYALRVWNGSHHNSISLHGHSHGSLDPYGLSLDVGVDCKEITSEYRPISFVEIMEYMSKRKVAVVDHHRPRDSQ